MGTIAARSVQTKLGGTAQILAILAIAIAQAVDLQMASDQTAQFSASALSLRRFVREISPELVSDRSLGAEIEALAVKMKSQAIAQ